MCCVLFEWNVVEFIYIYFSMSVKSQISQFEDMVSRRTDAHWMRQDTHVKKRVHIMEGYIKTCRSAVAKDIHNSGFVPGVPDPFNITFFIAPKQPAIACRFIEKPEHADEAKAEPAESVAAPTEPVKESVVAPTNDVKQAEPTAASIEVEPMAESKDTLAESASS